MAKQYIPIFAVGKYSNILPAITSGEIQYPAYIFCTDDKTFAFVDKDLNIQRVRGYNQEAIIFCDALPETDYRTDAFYICDGVGYLYMDDVPVPVFRNDSAPISYNDLLDTPMTNKVGTFTVPIILSELEDGCYSVSGQYQLTSDGTIYVTSQNIIYLVRTDDENKCITKVGAEEMVLYTIGLQSGGVTTARYVTDVWIKDNGYLTESDVSSIDDEKIVDLF